jgi:hypothetical protein
MSTRFRFYCGSFTEPSFIANEDASSTAAGDASQELKIPNEPPWSKDKGAGR